MSFRDMTAADAIPGDTVTSRWSSSGAIWVVHELYTDTYGRPCANLRSYAPTKTGKTLIDTRRLNDLRIVNVAPVPASAHLANGGAR